jgi:hypothetical protein
MYQIAHELCVGEQVCTYNNITWYIELAINPTSLFRQLDCICQVHFDNCRTMCTRKKSYIPS